MVQSVDAGPICKPCKGTGGSFAVPCSACGGRGRLPKPADLLTQRRALTRELLPLEGKERRDTATPEETARLAVVRATLDTIEAALEKPAP